MKQVGAQSGFQTADRLGHGGLGQLQFLGGPGEGAGLGHLGEHRPGLKVGKTRHVKS
ncbi:hypothetical protein GALL_543390 [mine drainage metagenome]|uniref:Uncharacterized protein n=1 Tax=mine drainage metagenome TaxID=410659 RepID=A0A1J5NXX4_9ZZZZ